VKNTKSVSFLLLILSAGFMTKTQAVEMSDDLSCMTLNLYWEARSEGPEGMLAVGWVVLNRINSSKYPNTVCSVVKQGGVRPPCEWNWYCDGRQDQPQEFKALTEAQKVASELLSNPSADPTGGALWFHLDSLSSPRWLQNREQSAHIGRHLFFR